MPNVFKLSKDAILPTRNKTKDAGIDIYANEDVFIPVGSNRIIQTGVCIEVPDRFVGMIKDRSSMAKLGLRVGAGVVDSGYSAEVGILLHNLSANTTRDPVLYEEGYQVRKGDKIAQMLIIPVSLEQVTEVDKIWSSERGSNGWGSSGK